MTGPQSLRASTPTGKWGLWDTEDKLWIGNDGGPLRYDDEIIARLCAETASRMLGWPIIRVRAMLFTEKGPMRVRDEKPVVRSAQQALLDLERGIV